MIASMHFIQFKPVSETIWFSPVYFVLSRGLKIPLEKNKKKLSFFKGGQPPP
jgi:hypothetical protein